jgi:hypothetical protein
MTLVKFFIGVLLCILFVEYNTLFESCQDFNMQFMPFQETWPSGPGQSQWLCLDGLKEIAVVWKHRD